MCYELRTVMDDLLLSIAVRKERLDAMRPLSRAARSDCRRPMTSI
jgi:hypothetical protein